MTVLCQYIIHGISVNRFKSCIFDHKIEMRAPHLRDWTPWHLPLTATQSTKHQNKSSLWYMIADHMRSLVIQDWLIVELLLSHIRGSQLTWFRDLTTVPTGSLLSKGA